MEKDITINDLLANNDVFADIADVNLFGGERVIVEEDLEAVPTDSSYKDLAGQHHKMFRDTLKKVRKLGGCIAFLGYESQMAVNNIMPVRDMGYAYTAYAGQIRELVAQNHKAGHNAYAKVLHDDQKLMPIATVILYFGREKWTKPLSLMDVLGIPGEEKEFWAQMLPDYKIRVVHMADQPEEVRKKYQSDFGIIADYLACYGDRKKLEECLRRDTRRLVHVEQVLDMLKAISGDTRFREIKEHYLGCDDKEERDCMCLLLDMCEEAGIQKGEEKGIRSLVEVCQEFGSSLVDTIEKVALKFGLNEEISRKKVEMYWKN